MSKMTGKNSIISKQYNRGLILQLIATGVCNTRIELAKKTKLTKMTVTNIISEFLDQGMVEECEEELTENCGRNPILLKIAGNAPKIIGLLIFRDRIEAVLCDMTMDILDMQSIYFDELDEERLIRNCYEVIDQLLEKEKNILGIGASVIGPVDLKSGIILNPPRFYGIQNVPVLEKLKERYSFPIYLDHDNNSAALVEKLYGIGKQQQDFLFLGVSNGIGSGIISNGEVYHSHRGLAPETGHISIDCNGPECSCGNKGCLEMYANTHVVLEKLRQATGKKLKFAQFCQMRECEQVDAIFRTMVENISVALISIVNILQPEMIVLGHDCVDWDDWYVQMLEDIINEKKLAQDKKKIYVRKAYFGKNAQLIGAAANVAVQTFQGKFN